ncbi:MAG: hypothetical protein II905_10155, partial [Muribaculaceae bacterium]|nr:hypothetical protein [Muribaculaceae bacterium]
MTSGTVRWFLEERADMERLARNHNAEAMAAYQPRFTAPRMVDGVEMVDAFIDISNQDVTATLKAHGVKVNCVFDGFVTALVPVERLAEVSCLPGVKEVEISRLVELCTDTTLSVTHAGQVLNGPDYGLAQAYDGTGVIIGVIDNGFDFQHTAFRRADDPSRSRI